MSNQTVPTVPFGPSPSQIVLTGTPTRGRVTFSLNGPAASFAKASLWLQTATTPFGYTEDIPLLVMAINPGEPNSVSQELRFNWNYYQFLFANLDIIDRSQKVGATMTMVV